MKINLPDIEVFIANESEANLYKVGESIRLLGSCLYFEKVCKSKKRLLVPNALKDKEWDKNPDIKLGMISYMGFPILWPDGEIFGTTCVLDVKENAYNMEYRDIISRFKEYIEAYLNLALSKYLKKDEKEISKKNLYYQSLFFKVVKILHDK